MYKESSFGQKIIARGVDSVVNLGKSIVRPRIIKAKTGIKVTALDRPIDYVRSLEPVVPKTSEITRLLKSGKITKTKAEGMYNVRQQISNDKAGIVFKIMRG